MAPKKNTPENDKKVMAKKKAPPPSKVSHSPPPELVLSPSSASSFSYSSSSPTAASPASVILHSGVTSLVSTSASNPSPASVVSHLGVASLVSTSANHPSHPSGAFVQQILSQSQIGARLPKEGLGAFGIKPAILSGCENNKNSKLKAVIIAERPHATMIFCCEPNNPNNHNGSWSEKAFFDAVHHKLEWVTAINVDNDMLHWYDNDMPQLNPKGYNIRLFVIPCSEVPAESSIINLAKYICTNINGMPNNSMVIEMNPQDLFWIPTAKGPVWSDIIGSDAALKMLMEKKGMPKPGYYFRNSVAIHSYFHPHTFMLDLAHALHAPIDQVHPEFCKHESPTADATDA